jgi:hypothetical protein
MPSSSKRGVMTELVRGRGNSAQEATSEARGLRRQLRSRLSAPNRSADAEVQQSVVVP